MLEELIEVSRIVGMRDDYVQAGGGNTSVKIDDEKMLIKSSGYLLSDMSTDLGVSTVNYKYIKENLYEGNYDELKNLENFSISGKKASIEVYLHAITKKYTVHIHSLLANIVLARKTGKKEVSELFPNSFYVEYETPGLDLAKKMLKYNKEDIIFLENHGIILTSDSYDEVLKLIDDVNKKISEYLGIDIKKDENVTKIYNLIKNYSNDLVYLVEDKDINSAFIKNNNKLWNYHFCPDCIVYCGIHEMILKKLSKEEVEEFTKKYGKYVLIVYEDNIYICAKNLKKAREIESVLRFSAKIYLNNNEDELNYIEEEETYKLYNCDFEKYRQNID